MLEGVVTNLLNQYLGQFLEGLDPEQLKISVWGGEVNLVDVKVKPGALDMLHLPLVVKYGYVKKLHLSANWRHLSSQPVRVELSGVYVVAVPSSTSRVDTAAEMQSALTAKLAKLQGMEDLRFGDAADEADGGDGSSDSYVGRMTAKIIDNVEVVIKDIHIRYEDFGGPHPPTSFGIALQELKAETVNDHWLPIFQKEPSSRAFKAVSLTNLFAYMNVDDKQGAQASAVASKLPPAHGAAKSASQNPDGAGPHKQLSVASLLSDPSTVFLLRPVSGFLRMIMHKEGGHSPRVWVESQLYDISLQLTELQYHQTLGLINRVSASHSSMAALMDSFQEHFRAGTIDERREYVRLYKATLNALWLPALEERDKKRKEQLEHELRYEDIRRYRLAAIAELKRELGIMGPSDSSGPPPLASAAAPSSPSSAPKKKDKNVDKARAAVMLREQATKLTSTFLSKLHLTKAKTIVPERELSDAERETIFADVESEVVEVVEEVAPDFVHVQAKFGLETLSFTLADAQNNALAELKAEHTSLALTVRDSTLSAIATLGNIIMSDKFTQGTLYPHIIRDVDRASGAPRLQAASPSPASPAADPSQLVRQGSSSSSISALAPGSHVLQVEVHTPPLDGSCDLRVAVRMKAPQIVVHQPFVERMIQFWTPPSDVDWSVLFAFGDADAVHQVQGFSSSTLSDTLRSHQSMDITLDVKAPTVIVPRDPTSAASDVLVLDLGAVKLTSRVQPKSQLDALSARLAKMTPAEQLQLDDAERAKLYDVRSIAIKQVQCYLTVGAALVGIGGSLGSPKSNRGSGGGGLNNAQAQRTYLLNPFDVTVELWECMSSELLNVPDMRVLGDLPLLNFSLSNSKYTRLMLLLATFQSIIDTIMADPVDSAVEKQQQQSLLSTSGLQSAQKLLQQSVTWKEEEEKEAAKAQSQSQGQSQSSGTKREERLDLAALAKLMPTLKDAQHLMAEIDKDGDGSISHSEFRSWCSARAKAREHNETLELAFQVQAIVLNLSNDVASMAGRADAASVPVMELRLQGIGVSMRQSVRQMRVGLVIGALSVQDCVSRHASSRFILNTSKHNLTTGGELSSAEHDTAQSIATSLAPPKRVPTPKAQAPVSFSSSSAPATSSSFIEGGEFINIALVTTSDKAASFASRPVEVDVRVGFSPVLVCLEPESLKRIGVYIWTVFVDNAEVNAVFAGQGASPIRPTASTHIASPAIASPQPKPRSAAAGGAASPPAPSTAVTSKPKKQKRDYRTSLNIGVHFESLKVRMFSKNDAVAEAVVDSLHGDLSMYSSGSVHLFAELRRVWVKDCTAAGAHYPFVVSTRTSSSASPSAASPAQGQGQHSSLVSLTYDSYSSNEADYPGHNEAVRASVHGLQFVYLQRFVWEMQLFFTMGPVADLLDFVSSDAHEAGAAAPQAATDMSAAAAALSQEYAKQAVERFVHMDLSVSGVDLLVPHHSSSDELLLARIDKIALVNDLLRDEHQDAYMQVSISGTPFEISSLIRAHADTHKPLLALSPFNVIVNLLSHQSRIDVDIESQALEAVLAPAQYNWLLTLPQLNMAETATVMKPIKKRAHMRGRGMTGASPYVTSSHQDRGMQSPPNLSLPSPADSSSSSSSSLPPTAVVFKLNAALHDLAFTLTENEHVGARGDQSAKGALAVFNMNRLFTGVQIMANGGMDVSSFCTSMSMTDVSEGGSHVKGRPILPAYRQLLLIVQDATAAATPTSPSQQKRAPSKPPVSFTLHKTVDEQGTGWSVIDLSVANFRFNLGPVLLRLPTFFAPPPTAPSLASAAVLDDLSRQSLSLTPQVPAAPAAPAPRTASYMVIKLNVANPIVQLVQDPTAQVSEALLLTFGLNTDILVSDNEQRTVLSADVNLNGFKVYSTHLDVDKIAFVQLGDDTRVSGVILQPFSVRGTVKLTTPRDAVDPESILEPLPEATAPISLPTLSARLVVDPIAVRISYLTYRLALRTLDALSKATSEEEAHLAEREEEAAQKMLEDLQKVATVARPTPKPVPAGSLSRIPLGEKRGGVDGADGEHGVVDAAMPLDVSTSGDELDSVVHKPAQSALFFAEEIEIELRQAHVSLINDANGSFDIPIARAQIENVSVKVHGFAHHRTVRANMRVSADYYNQRVVLWEPMIDPYTLQADFVQTYILSTAAFNATLDPNTAPSQLPAAPSTAEPSASSASSSSLVNLESGSDLTIGSHDHSGAVLSTKLTISSPMSLNLNVTHTMYRGVLESIKLFAVDDAAQQQRIGSGGAGGGGGRVSASRNAFRVLKDGNKSGAMSRSSLAPGSSLSAGSMSDIIDARTFYPFRFENYSEFAIEVVRQAHRPEAAAGASAQQQQQQQQRRDAEEKAQRSHNSLALEPYSTLSFDFPPSIHASEYELGVHVYREQGGSSVLQFAAAMRTMRTQTFQIPVDSASGSGGGRRSARLIFELEVLDGVKVCRLRGVVGLRNNTSFPLEFKTMPSSSSPSSRAAAGAGAGAGAALEFPILQPGDLFYMPLIPTHESGGFMLVTRPRNTTAGATAGRGQSSSGLAGGVVASQFAWSSPFILLQDYSTQNQFCGSVHQGNVAAAGSAALVGATGDRPPALVSPVTGSDGNFNCSVSIHHQWEHAPSTSAADETPGSAGVKAGRPFTAQIYELGPAISLQNLLAADVEVRIAEKNASRQEIVHWSSSIARGDRRAVHLMLHTQTTYIQLRIPSLQTRWSDLLALPQVPPEGHTTATYCLSLYDDNNRELMIHLEAQIKGTVRLALFVPFWVFDLTRLGCVMSCDAKQTVPLGPLDSFRSTLTSDVRSPLMFNFPRGYAGKKEVRLTTLHGVENAANWNDVQWSAPISIDKLGLATTMTIKGAKQQLPGEREAWLRSLSDIGVQVTQAGGKFRRTKLIHLVPHYIFINNLNCDVELMQRVSLNPQLVHARSCQAPTFVLKAGEQKEYHWTDHAANRTVCLRRMGAEFAEWRWSGELDPSSLGDLSIMVRHKSDPNRLWFLRAEIHVQGATVFVQFSEYDANTLHSLMPYRIQNQTVHQTMRIRQHIPAKGSKECTIPVPQCDWITVPSYSVLHFAPEVSLYSRPCLVEIQLGLAYREGAVVAEKTVMANLDEVRTHGRVALSAAIGDELGDAEGQTLFLYTESDGSATNVLKVSNYPSADSFSASLRKAAKGQAVTAKTIILKQRERRWAELQETHGHLIARLNALGRRMAQETARVTAASKSNAMAARPTSVPPRDSALVIEIKGARGVRIPDAYIRVCFDGLVQRTPAVQARDGRLAWNKQFIFSTTRMQGTSVCRLELWEENSWPRQHAQVGFVEFSLYDLSHDSRTSWLALRANNGDTVAEVEATLWHVPKADSQLDASYAEAEAQLNEKKRILRAVEAEMKSMIDRQMVDERGRLLPVHLQNDVQFRLSLLSIEGLDRALARMNNRGDVVCRVRSELTGKTASVLCMQYDPAEAARDKSLTGAAAGVSTPGGQARSRPALVSWGQEVPIYVPEEMLAARDEVLHLAFFFHPEDSQTDGEGSVSPTTARGAMQNESFLKATRLRANCPPIPLAHTSVPLNSVSEFGSAEYKESQSPRNDPRTARGGRALIDWRMNRLPLQVDLSSTDLMWATVSVVRLAARSEASRSQFCLNLVLPQLTLSLIDAAPAEILFLSLSGLLLSADDTLSSQDVSLKLDALQLDNQSVGALFPTVIGFTPVEPEDLQPIVQLSVAKKKTRLPHVHVFEYASLLIQQLDVKVEEELIYTVIRFVGAFNDGDDDTAGDAEAEEGTGTSGSALSVFDERVSRRFCVNKTDELMLFFSFLQIQPLAVNVWFEAAPGMRARMSDSQYNPMELVLSFAGTALASMHAAPIRLNGRTFEHVRGSPAVILGSLAHFYQKEIVAEAYKLVGALEFLGNPVGMVSSLGSGVSDFFYLPAKGAVESPEKFGLGLAKGSLSLVKGTISGIFGSVGSITGSMSKGLAVASMDEKFIEKTGSKQQTAPKNAAEGLFQGTKSLAGGLFKGITGIVTDPLKGAREGGTEGFFKGMGKGLLGVVAKPAAGAAGFASQTLTGIGNTPEYLSDNKLHPRKLRPQRHIAPAVGLEPFNLQRAQKHEEEQRAMLKRKGKGKA